MGLFSCCQNVHHILFFFLELLESMKSGSSSLPAETEKQIVKQGNNKVPLRYHVRWILTRDGKNFFRLFKLRRLRKIFCKKMGKKKL